MVPNRMLIKSILAATLVAASFLPSVVAAQTARSPVAPRRELVESVVREAYEKFRSDPSGKNADYIPYLAQVDSKMLGMSSVSPDCRVLLFGYWKYSFS